MTLDGIPNPYDRASLVEYLHFMRLTDPLAKKVKNHMKYWYINWYKGNNAGNMNIWKLSTGQCVRSFPSAHQLGITSVHFTKDNLQVVTSSYDMLIRIHGLKSGKILKEFR